MSHPMIYSTPYIGVICFIFNTSDTHISFYITVSSSNVVNYSDRVSCKSKRSIKGQNPEHYENLPMQYTENLSPKFDVFNIYALNSDCG